MEIRRQLTEHKLLFVRADELQLADVVEAFAGPYGTATVKQIKDGEITFFRPYVASGDFSYTGGVICTVGIEEFKVPANANTYRVLQRERTPLR